MWRWAAFPQLNTGLSSKKPVGICKTCDTGVKVYLPARQ